MSILSSTFLMASIWYCYVIFNNLVCEFILN
jgi:hypothetical protein